jgi:four helix bundle protein
VTYEQWEACAPSSFRDDSVWKVKAYRLGVFLSDLAWQDVSKLVSDTRTRNLAGQLYDAACSISSNISEGYSRNTGRERARFYEFSLGSARESRDRYYQGRHILGQGVSDHRIQWCTEIVRLTLRMVPDQRRTNRSLSRAGSAS